MTYKTPWVTTESVAMVREMATRRCKNEEIAAAVTAKFGIFVNPNMIAGRISRMKDIPPRSCPGSTKRDHFWWVSSRPMWGTPEADTVVLKARLKFISYYRICVYFNVSENTAKGALNRATRAERMASYDDHTKHLAKHTSKEWPIGRVKRLIELYEAGSTYAEMRVDPQIAIAGEVTHTMVQKKVERLRVAGLVSARENIAKTLVKRPSKKAAVAREIVEAARPVRINPVSLERTLPVNTVRGLVVTGVSQPPCCAWRGCTSPAHGKWCSEHGALLRAPAQDISRQLHTWR